MRSSTIVQGIVSAVFLTWWRDKDQVTEFLSYSWILPDSILHYELYSLHATCMMLPNELLTLAHTRTFLLNSWYTLDTLWASSAGKSMHKRWLMISLVTENIWILSLLLRFFFFSARKIGSLMLRFKTFFSELKWRYFHQAAPNAESNSKQYVGKFSPLTKQCFCLNAQKIFWFFSMLNFLDPVPQILRLCKHS